MFYVAIKSWIQTHLARCLRVLGYIITFVLATKVHFYFSNLLGRSDDYVERWDGYAIAAQPYRLNLLIYIGSVVFLTLVMATFISIVIVKHWKEPAYRALVPSFLLHLGIINFAMPLVELCLQLKHIYHIELGSVKWTSALAMFAESYGLIILGAALLARLRVMYLVFRKGDFDVQYKKVVLRVVFCAVLPSLCVFMIYLPEKYFFIAGLILRLLLVSVILETIYYCVRLRKTKYLRDQYVGLLTTCGISIVSILYLAIILPNLNSSVRVIDHFNAIMVVVWVFNVELIGPSVYQTFVAHLHRNNHINYDNVSLSLVINKRSKRTGLQTVLDDDRLYPTLLKIAQERYCEENVLFLHDGKLLYNSLKMYQTEADAQKQACEATPVSTDDNQSPARKIELVRTTIHDCSRSETCKKQEENVRVSTRDTHSTVDESPGDTGVVSDHCTPRLVTELYQFLDKYVMRSAPTPVNLASSQISVLRQARSFDRLSRNDADNIMNVLVLSLADVEILFESSGVLAKFERTSAITGICAEREAVIRLGIETREELQ